MAFQLSDDGTLDTVLECEECGKEIRFTYGGGFDGSEEDATDEELQQGYDNFVEWAMGNADQDHECEEGSEE